MSASESGRVAADMKAVARNPPDLEAARRLAADSPYHNAIMRTTCVATRLEAGHADNALPQFARAIINCRVFPGDSIDYVRTTPRRNPGRSANQSHPYGRPPIEPCLPTPRRTDGPD